MAGGDAWRDLFQLLGGGDDDGRLVQHNQVLSSKSTIKALTARSEALTTAGPNADPAQIAAIEEQYAGVGYKPSKPRPELFEKKADGSTKLKAMLRAVV